ncbi:helix-turn-helix domain-containing protein [Streptococcus sp. H49]|uniref:helix-turn-helix domain-containing protein n=1 Tax=Streptococcus huangxiaojuni TaxID=3237239 RepID=UPI0034A493CA
MTTLGETVKIIRKQKKLTQQSVYEGIVSRNFASRFENGRSNIEANKLFLILSRLDISASEFQFIHFDNKDYKFREMISKIDKASIRNDEEKLNEIYGQFRKDFSLSSQVIASVAYLKIYVHGNNPLKLSLAPVYPLQIHLLEASDWSLFELRLFVDGIFIFRTDENGLLICLEKAIKAFEKYYDYPDFSIEVAQSMASIVLNYVQIQLINFNYSKKDYNKDLITLSNSNKFSDFTAKLTLDFASLLPELYFKELHNNTRQKIMKFLNSLRELHFPDYDIFREIFDYHLVLSMEYYRKSMK